MAATCSRRATCSIGRCLGFRSRAQGQRIRALTRIGWYGYAPGAAASSTIPKGSQASRGDACLVVTDEVGKVRTLRSFADDGRNAWQAHRGP